MHFRLLVGRINEQARLAPGPCLWNPPGESRKSKFPRPRGQLACVPRPIKDHALTFTKRSHEHKNIMRCVCSIRGHAHTERSHGRAHEHTPQSGHTTRKAQAQHPPTRRNRERLGQKDRKTRETRTTTRTRRSQQKEKSHRATHNQNHHTAHTKRGGGGEGERGRGTGSIPGAAWK